MKQKKTDVSPSVVATPQVTDPNLLYHTISTNEAIRHIHPVMRSGQVLSKRSFPVHSGLIGRLRYAYSQQNTDLFLSALTDYCQQAAPRIPGAVPLQQVEALIAEVKQLIGQVGLVPVAQFLLQNMT